MLFPESDASLLRAWIIKRLANTFVYPFFLICLYLFPEVLLTFVILFHCRSDADADVLADYVLALLRHDGDVETIRKIFEEEIPDFLREGTMPT